VTEAIVAVDPGTEQSAVLTYSASDGRWSSPIIAEPRILPNLDLLYFLRQAAGEGRVLAIEMVASYGMPVGKEVFETCVWIGRFVEAWRGKYMKVYRQEVKLHLCGSARATDATIRKALIDKLGAPGTKKAPGATYGLKADLWSALAVAVTAVETRRARSMQSSQGIHLVEDRLVEASGT